MLLYGYGYYGMFYDPTYILIFIGIGISLIASGMINSTYSKYSKVYSKLGITGAQAADRILKSKGLFDVKITMVKGKLTDHYDPRTKVLALSEGVYNSSSVAAIGVAAHECGHAIQHEEEYQALTLRSLFVPVANIGSKISWVLILIGFMIGLTTSTGYNFVFAGIIAFATVLVFQVITLPVEFNASKRALVILADVGILYDTEILQAKKVLNAAALTYVAAVITSALSIIRLVILASGGRRRD